MNRSHFIIALLFASVPTMATADIIGIYAAGKGDFVQGTGDAFEGLDASMGYGAEAGIEFLGMELWGEALVMGAEQYLMTANFGFGLELGGDVRITAGVYTGPMFFKFSPRPSEGLQLPSDVRTILDSGAVPNITSATLEEQYNAEFAEKEKQANEMAFGWNLVRGRVLVEYSLIPFVTIGLGGHAGYHYVLDGKAAVGELRSQAIDRLADEYMLDSIDSSLRDKLKEAAGAKAIDEEELGGVNYNVGAFLKVKL